MRKVETLDQTVASQGTILSALHCIIHYRLWIKLKCLWETLPHTKQQLQRSNELSRVQ